MSAEQSANGRDHELCNFCGKSRTEVMMLIVAATDVCICDECVWLCVEIIDAREESPVLAAHLDEDWYRAFVMKTAACLSSLGARMMRAMAEREQAPPKV